MEEWQGGQVTTQYVWIARYIDAPVCKTIDWGTFYYTTDANMNVTALVNTDGLVVERYVYDAYGKVTFLNSAWEPLQLGQNSPGTVSQFGNEILYAGYRYNPETGNYQVRNREYSPMVGRWLQRDPAGYVNGNNLYQYARSNPAHFTDPSGLLTPTEFWDEWGEEQRQEWIANFEKKFGNDITAAAEKNAIPRSLLAAIIANEQIDYSEAERLGESWGLGSSVGPAHALVKNDVSKIEVAAKGKCNDRR